MNINKLSQHPILCPECFQVTVTVNDKDNDYNIARLKEQQTIRSKDEPFNFNFRCTCSECGCVYINKIIKNIKIK